MKAITFRIDLADNIDSVVALFTVPSSTDAYAVQRTIASLLSACAVEEGVTVAVMEAELSTIMTLTRVATGTQIEMKRMHDDALYFGRFEKSLIANNRLLS